jgi:hypothetical protein
VKSPATEAGIPAIEAAIAEGINVNVTLMFSVEVYKRVARAYIAGLRARHERGEPVPRVARVATLLARPFAGDTSDPMSGFFALKRLTFDRAQRLTPLGYKIGLELMCKCRVEKVREIPVDFGTRHAGVRKLSLKEQFRYLEHLSRLYDLTYPRLSPILKFAMVVGLGKRPRCRRDQLHSYSQP